jgi:dTDP-4-amino-4,6-dideoxygalactose transaminase
MTGRIPIADPDVGGAEIERVADVIREGPIADGPEVRDFESAFADHCDAEEAVATSNGTTALHAALVAAGVGDGDRVLTTPFTFIASVNAIRLVGAEPVFADVDPVTFNLDPEAVEERLRADEDLDAILAVHLYGLPAPMPELTELAETHDVALVEDAAQAHGATIDGEHVGTFGDAATFSFYPTKNMTTAEGGMVTTDDPELADRVRSFINHGRTREGSTYAHASVGHNFRLTSVAAAIGQVQLEKLPDYVEARREHAARFTGALEDAAAIDPPVEPAGYRHGYHQYTVRCEDREALRSHLDDAGVDTAIYYPTPVHEQPPYADVGGSFPHAERASEEVVSLPVHPGLSASDVDRIVEALEGFE